VAFPKEMAGGVIFSNFIKAKNYQLKVQRLNKPISLLPSHHKLHFPAKVRITRNFSLAESIPAHKYTGQGMKSLAGFLGAEITLKCFRFTTFAPAFQGTRRAPEPPEA